MACVSGQIVRVVSVALLGGLILTANCVAIGQGNTSADPNQGFPPPPPDPNQGFLPSPSGSSQGFPTESARVDLKQVFANTLAVAAASAGGAVINSLVGAITGGIANWFSAKKQNRERAQAQDRPSPQRESSHTFNPSLQSHVTREDLAGDEGIAAGIAFEVHALLPDGSSIPVDTNSHRFATRDQFIVFYRPSLPGTLDVFNINPLGQETFIETLNLAGGELVKMGPYEFTNTSGEERLRLLMHPCTTPELLAGTRDIVKAGTGGGLSADGMRPTLRLPVCGTAGRSLQIRTRDIKKVELDGNTTFALDQLSPQELSSGIVDARQLVIVFRHE